MPYKSRAVKVVLCNVRQGYFGAMGCLMELLRSEDKQ